MLMLISPSKTLDFSDNLPNNLKGSNPFFAKEASQLVQVLEKYSSQDISELMSLSDKLGQLNYQRFQNFASQPQKPALYAYKGDVYEGFELNTYKQEDIAFANQHLRIISGLYGVLKPLDLIKPYRLEMSINLPNNKGKNLYLFWENKITNKLNEEQDDLVINLASQEYFSAINPKILNKKIINITFKEKHKDGYKIIGIHAKKARGIMANYIILNSINKASQIKDFNLNGYIFSSQLSSENEYVFIR
jgi:cytoplasmic iron level regulating protein YaaA (DUF328/UPF0246 family)